MSDVSTVDVFKGLPRRVQVGPRTFRVVLTNADKTPDLDGNWGLTDDEQFRIYLHEDMPAHMAAEIVQHEVSHCVNAVYGVDDDSTEEQFVTQHSRGLTEVWLRNPRLHNWIIKTIRRARKEASRD